MYISFCEKTQTSTNKKTYQVGIYGILRKRELKTNKRRSRDDATFPPFCEHKSRNDTILTFLTQ